MEVVVHHGFVIVIRRASLEIYGIPPLPDSDTIIFPVAQHNWQRLDTVTVAPQALRRGNRPSALGILIRFASGLPWVSFPFATFTAHIDVFLQPVNLLHYFILCPNQAFDACRPVDQTNVPYEVAPKIRRTIGSPIRLFTPYHMVMGNRGTAIWIDTHTEDYFGRSGRGQRLAAILIATSEAEDHLDEVSEEDYIVPTMDVSVFGVCEEDNWTRVAVHEEEGRVAIGSIDGTVTILEYA